MSKLAQEEFDMNFKHKTSIKELKEWVIRQREVLASADDDFFTDIDETKEDWLEQELLTLFEMIENLEDK